MITPIARKDAAARAAAQPGEDIDAPDRGHQDQRPAEDR